MKKSIFGIALALSGLLCACASGGKPTNEGLDAAIQQASQDIGEALPSGTKVALINFTSPSNVFSDYVLEEMSILLVKAKKVVVVDRKEIELIRNEMDFQMSGEVSDASAQQIGKLLGAQSIVSGSLVSIGEIYRFRTKVINVNTAAIETSLSLSVQDDPQMQYLLAQNGQASTPQTATSGGIRAIPAQASPAPTGQPAAPAPSPAAPVLTAYKIGDTGPAGGLIFYDKGNNSNGWRYLEAAPVEAEFQAKWSVHRTRVEDTQTDIGSGKRNTQLIVETFRQTAGEWDTAAQKSADLIFNGFNDWFLPSRDELDQMYGNLKRKKLGDFKNDSYWASNDANFWGYGTTTQNFKDGKMDVNGKEATHYVRPIRQVPGPNTATRSSAVGGTDSTGGKKTGVNWSKVGIYGLSLAVVVGIVTWLIVSPPKKQDAAVYNYNRLRLA